MTREDKETFKISSEVFQYVSSLMNENDSLWGEAMEDEEARLASLTSLLRMKSLANQEQQIKSLQSIEKSCQVLKFFRNYDSMSHKLLEGKLTGYCMARPLGKYVCGLFVPPTIAASLVSSLKIKNQEGKVIYKNPRAVWILAHSHNPNDLITLAIGRFIKDIPREDKISGYYSNIYQERLKTLTERNEDGKYERETKNKLKLTKNPYVVKCYLKGKYPVEQLQENAAEWTAKVFISNFWEALYEQELDRPAPQSYISDGETRVFLERPIVTGIVGIAYLNVKNSSTYGVVKGKAPEGSLEPTPLTDKIN
jgi:hypothetical protein